MGMCKSMPWDWHLLRLIFCLTLGCFLVSVCHDIYSSLIVYIFLKPTFTFQTKIELWLL